MREKGRSGEHVVAIRKRSWVAVAHKRELPVHDSDDRNGDKDASIKRISANIKFYTENDDG